MQDRTPDSLRRFLCVMHSVRTHSGRAGVSLRFRAAKTTTGEDLMLLSGSLHHPQTHRDTLNQHNLLLLLFFFHLTGPKRRSQSLSLSPSSHFLPLSHTQKRKTLTHCPLARQRIHFSKQNRANYPVLFVPPPPPPLSPPHCNYLQKWLPLHHR